MTAPTINWTITWTTSTIYENAMNHNWSSSSIHWIHVANQSLSKWMHVEHRWHSFDNHQHIYIYIYIIYIYEWSLIESHQRQTKLIETYRTPIEHQYWAMFETNWTTSNNQWTPFERVRNIFKAVESHRQSSKTHIASHANLFISYWMHFEYQCKFMGGPMKNPS